MLPVWSNMTTIDLLRGCAAESRDSRSLPRMSRLGWRLAATAPEATAAVWMKVGVPVAARVAARATCTSAL